MLSCIPSYLEKVLCKQGNVAWLDDDLRSVFENGNLMAGKIKCPFSFSKLNHALAVIQNLNLYYSHLAFCFSRYHTGQWQVTLDLILLASLLMTLTFKRKIFVSIELIRLKTAFLYRSSVIVFIVNLI